MPENDQQHAQFSEVLQQEHTSREAPQGVPQSIPENAPVSEVFQQVVTSNEAPQDVPQLIAENTSSSEDRQQAKAFKRGAQAAPKKDFTPGKQGKIYIPDSKGCMGDSENVSSVHTDKLLSIVKHAGPVINPEMHTSTATASSQNDALCCYRSLRRKKCAHWGGPFRELLAKEDYSLFDFIVNNVPFDGISSIFHTSSGWPRTIFYAFCFTATGYFFVATLIKPLVHQYQNRDVNLVNDYVTHKDGFPYPILTVCPKGSGIRCDCQLWKRLACHYSDNPDLPFKSWTCDVFAFTGAQPLLLDSMCLENWNVSSLDWSDDTCGGVINGEDLFNTVIQREREEGKPYMSIEEQTVYGGARFAPANINFRFLNDTYGYIGQAVNFKYLNYTHLDCFNGRICVQLRLPPEAKQIISGPNDGIQIIVSNFLDNLITTAHGAGVDVYIENNKYKRDDRVFLYGDSVPASPNHLTSISYGPVYHRRISGYGGESSKNCIQEGEPRNVCIQKKALNNLRNNCEFCTKVKYASYFGFSDNVAEQFYDAFGCDTDCKNNITVPSVSFKECPIRCNEIRTNINGYYPIDQTEYQKKLYKLIFGTTHNVTDMRIGIDSFDIGVATETPAQTLGGLIGSIGGNLNLWFGPDFMNALWFLELIIFGCITMFVPLPMNRNRA